MAAKKQTSILHRPISPTITRVILGLLIIIVIALGFYVFKSKHTARTKLNTKVDQTRSTSFWKTFTDERKTLELQYPQDWIAPRSCLSGIAYCRQSLDYQASFENGEEIPTRGESLRLWYDHVSALQNYYDKNCVNNMCKYITVGGKKALQISLSDKNKKAINELIVVQVHPDLLLMMEFMAKNMRNYNEVRLPLDHILSSIKFATQ